MSFTITMHGFDEAIRDLGAIPLAVQGKIGKQILGTFWTWWSQRRFPAWNEIKASGGAYFSAAWPKMKDQYTRKTDGVTVPAWGGVPRIYFGFRKRTKGPGRGVSTGERMSRVSGNVSGKLRPSHQRVRQGSVMMVDTGRMRQDFLTRPKELTGTMLHIGPKDAEVLKYAGAQNDRRPFAFFEEPTDEQQLTKFGEAEFDALAARFNGGQQP